MASYKKYAENLVGNWETGQYEPQRKVTQSIYQTNINKLADDFSALKDKLARNFENAQLEYANTMNNVQNQSFNRMRNADIDLANRGLSTSGVGDLVTQADVQQKGEDVDKALADLLAVNNASIEGLTSGVMNLGEKQSSLAGDLAGDLGGVTEQEAANAQQYANLIAGLGNSAANRAASRARSGGGTSKKDKKAQAEVDELKRRMMIADTLTSDQFSSEEKIRNLYNYLDVPIDTARAVVQGYDNNQLLENNTAKLQAAQNKANTYANANANWLKIANNPATPNVVRGAMNIFNVPNAASYYNNQNINKLQNEISGLDYTDLYNLLYGKK